jgi:hypothetical protein
MTLTYFGDIPTALWCAYVYDTLIIVYLYQENLF